jgi:hypothetical protein
MTDRRSNDATAMAGEFFAMQILYRLGHQPALTLGVAKAIDILVRTACGRLLEVSVKSVCGGGKWGVGTEDLSARENRIFVFLHFTTFEDVAQQPEAFVIPAQEVQQLKEEWFDQYAVYFSNPDRRARLEQYRDAWPRFFVKGRSTGFDHPLQSGGPASWRFEVCCPCSQPCC